MRFSISPLVSEYNLNSEELAALLRVVIEDGFTASLNAPGSSMIPFIRSEDKIFVSPVEEKPIRIGDILAFIHAIDGRVIAHRVVRIAGDRFLCKGDNVTNLVDGWISIEDVLGRVIRVQRDGKPVRFGLGIERKLIAFLSLKTWLVPLIDLLRRVKGGIARFFSGIKQRPLE